MNLKDLQRIKEELIAPPYLSNKRRKGIMIPKIGSTISVTVSKEFGVATNALNWNILNSAYELSSGKSVVISGTFIEFDKDGNLWLSILGKVKPKPRNKRKKYSVRLAREAIISIMTNLAPEDQKSFGFKPLTTK